MSEFVAPELVHPTNALVTPLLTDMYQISMAFAYWKNNKENDHAIFDLFFRKNPFKGEFTVFAGLDEVLKFVMSFRFSESDITYLQTVLPHAMHFYKDIEQPPSATDGNSAPIKTRQTFFDWLRQLTTQDVRIYACEHGSVVFPRTPLIRVEGPLAVTQLLETGLLNLVNYPSLIATNAARMRNAVGPDKLLLEFGLRRAQGPDGGISASKYAYVGGFNATSNVLAGKLFDIAVRGTHAHSFVMSYASLNDLFTPMITTSTGEEINFLAKCLFYRQLLQFEDTNDGELAAFIAYAQSFPHGFLALIDTYDSLQSGTKNFVIVGMALLECGYKPLGIRLDSGDLAYISRQVRRLFQHIDQEYRANNKHFLKLDFYMSKCTIVASNDIDEEVLLSLQQQRSSLGVLTAPSSPSTTASVGSSMSDPSVENGDHLIPNHNGHNHTNHNVVCSDSSTSSASASVGNLPCSAPVSLTGLRVHEIDVFGIGTNLVTCRMDPALGCVYKLVEINGIPRIKVSQEMEKIVIPSRKHVYRLFGKDGFPLVDVMLAATEPPPKVHEKILVKHPFRENVEVYVKPAKIETLLHMVYDGPAVIKESSNNSRISVNDIHHRLLLPHCNLSVARNRCLQQLASMREDHLRPVNPTPYKVSVSPLMYDGIRALLKKEKKETILS